MARWKHSCQKWTLVIIIISVCPLVYSRPSESNLVSSTATSVTTGKPTENKDRYKSNYYNSDLKYNSSSTVISHINLNKNHYLNHYNFTIIPIDSSPADILDGKLDENNVTRGGRSYLGNAKSKIKRSGVRRKNHNTRHTNVKETNLSNESQNNKMLIKKPPIRKIITKWRDKVDFNDVSFASNSEEKSNDKISFKDSTELYSTEDNEINVSTETLNTVTSHKKWTNIKDKIYTASNNKLYRPYPQYSEEMHVYSSNINIIDDTPTTRPMYTYNTPTPTPIITNVGMPKPWGNYKPQSQYQTVIRKTTTRKPNKVTKPIKHNTHHNYQQNNNYPQQYVPNHNTFEVTTFQPVNGYTDRIIIRPEEYSASSDDCPTIFLTLNNTFQGQGKEACPDLNIAVNTNVVNKNVVVESEEEDIENDFFPGGFGLPLDDSASEEAPINDYFESAQTAEEPESASVESNAFTNYNAAPSSEVEVAPAGYGTAGSPSSALSGGHKPNKDDDDFLTALTSFLRPAFKVLGWFSTANPLNFGLFSLLMTPIALAIAGTSGVTALFAPWALADGRKAPKVVHVYRPYWHWDNKIKTWHLHNFPDNRKWQRRPRNSKEETKPNNKKNIRSTWFYKIKEIMKASTVALNNLSDNNGFEKKNKENRRKKREIFKRRII